MKHVLTLFIVLAALAVLGKEPDFYGVLIVTCDSGDSLPVFLDGKRIGKTPMMVDKLAVGNYSVSFMAPAVRDSILQKQRSALPKELQKSFEKIDPLSVAQFSTQTVIIKNRQRTEAIFRLKEIQSAVHGIDKDQYLKIALASVLMIAAFIVIFTQAF